MNRVLSLACSVAALLSVSVLGACASSGPALPDGMSEGVFSRLQCESGKSFSARFAEGAGSVRVRGLHGSSELALVSPGVYEGEGYRFVTSSNVDGIALFHSDKVEARLCKAIN
jgi:hypothetical protein